MVRAWTRARCCSRFHRLRMAWSVRDGLLAAVEVVEEPLRRVVTLTCPYSLAGKLQDRTVRGGGVVVRSDYDAAVTLVLALPVDDEDLLATLLDHPGVRQH